MTRLGSGALVGALVAVKACGDVLGEDGRVLAGARDAQTGRFLDSAAWLRRTGRIGGFPRNTVLAAIATDVRLYKIGCARVADVAHHGIAAAISPSHLSVDRDTVFALSTGDRDGSAEAVGTAATAVPTASIRRAVRAARGLHGVLGLAGHAPG